MRCSPARCPQRRAEPLLLSRGWSSCRSSNSVQHGSPFHRSAWRPSGLPRVSRCGSHHTRTGGGTIREPGGGARRALPLRRQRPRRRASALASRAFVGRSLQCQRSRMSRATARLDSRYGVRSFVLRRMASSRAFLILFRSLAYERPTCTNVMCSETAQRRLELSAPVWATVPCP